MKTITTALVMMTASTLASDRWEKLPPMPEPIGGFIAAEEDGKLVLIGGTTWRGDAKHFLTSRYVFDPAKMAWEKGPSVPEPIAYAVSGNWNGKLAWGGGTNGDRSVRRITTAPGEMLPELVVLSGGGLIGDELVFAGGTDDPAKIDRTTRAAFSVNLKSGEVTKLPDFPGKGFGVAASAILGGQLFLFGGANWDAEKSTVVNTADAYALTLSTREWRQLKPFPFPVRGLTGIALDDRLIYLAGGYKNDVEEFSPEGFFYDTKTDTYSSAPRPPYRAMVALVKVGEYLYCFGGEDKKKSRTDECWRIPLAKLLP